MSGRVTMTVELIANVASVAVAIQLGVVRVKN
jgi:hypothetical protein